MTCTALAENFALLAICNSCQRPCNKKQQKGFYPESVKSVKGKFFVEVHLITLAAVTPSSLRGTCEAKALRANDS
jgi:hypothetical protein